MSSEETQAADDPSGDGWRWVHKGELLRHGDVEHIDGDWHPIAEAGYTCSQNHLYRRRIEPQQPSDSEPDIVQQLRDQVQALTRERDRYRNQLAGAIEHSKRPKAQAQLVERLQEWLRPVMELVTEHPDDCGPLAVAVVGYLPEIASRLIEE